MERAKPELLHTGGATLRFGSFALDLDRGALLRPDGTQVALRPKTADILRHLVERAGYVVARDELLEAVWPGVYVSEDSVTQCVAEIRRALGDASASLLRTLPKRGYLLDTKSVPAAAPPDDAVATQSHDLLNPAIDQPSLVVLPFSNLSDDAQQDYFVDGLVEEITTALACINSFFVIARNSAFTYKNRVIDVRNIGRELGVRYVLDGSVRKSGSRIRIVGQLIDAVNNTQIWADRFDGSLDDVFGLQDLVTSCVAGAIEPRLQRAEIERAQRKPTQNLGAYDYFLRGLARDHLNRPEDLKAAREMFAEAFARDPTYSTAYGMAALTVFHMKSTGLLTKNAPEVPEGIQWADIAVKTGWDNATALWTAGVTLTYVGMNPEAGTLLLDRACSLNPNSARAWGAAGYTRNCLGDAVGAIRSYERAMRLSPKDPNRPGFLHGVAQAYIQDGKYAEAIDCAERAVRERPGFIQGRRTLISALAMAGQIKEARREMSDLLCVAPHLRLSDYVNFMGPFRRPDFAARIIESYRISGMPE